MAWWNAFTTSIAAVPTALKRLTGGGNYLSDEERAKEETLHNHIILFIGIDCGKFINNATLFIDGYCFSRGNKQRVLFGAT